jgi:hypothetical protein
MLQVHSSHRVENDEVLWYNPDQMKYGFVPIGAGHTDEDPTTRKSSSYRMNNIPLCAQNFNPQHFPLSLPITSLEEVAL